MVSRMMLRDVTSREASLVGLHDDAAEVGDHLGGRRDLLRPDARSQAPHHGRPATMSQWLCYFIIHAN